MSHPPIDRKLLIALRQGKHFKANPGDVRELLGDESSEADSAARRLLAQELIRSVPDSSRPGRLIVRITDKGIGEADLLIEAERKPTFKERIASIDVGKASWEVTKLVLAAIVGALAKAYFG